MRTAAIILLALFVFGPAPPAESKEGPRAVLRQVSAEISAQARRARRVRVTEPRARTRIEVRPLRRPSGPSVVSGPYDTPSLRGYRRECVPVFEERVIPQWGGSVLYASQNCRWVRG